jgi:hypothetical protein
MITIPGFGDHVQADWPITINGMRTSGVAVIVLLSLDVGRTYFGDISLTW